MGGFGVVTATVLMCLIFISSFGVLVNIVNDGVLELNDIYRLQFSKLQDQVRTRIAITNTIVESTTILRVNVTNLGATSIRVKDFVKMDVILTYISENSSPITVWLAYSPTGGDVWYIDKVFTGDKEGDILNPISVENQTGLWDPGEIIEIKLNLTTPINASRGYGIVIVLPNGVKAVYSG